MRLDAADRHLIDRYQRNLPICERPYEVMAQHLGLTEQEVIERLSALQEQQVLSRVGPVFEHSKAGASLLAAVAAPDDQIDLVAAQNQPCPGGEPQLRPGAHLQPLVCDDRSQMKTRWKSVWTNWNTSWRCPC